MEVCRICRGESTPSEPLFHPCKCKGSIKYIHQQCLMEWLKHSSKSNQCDICNSKYKFKTIYDPNMPETIPVTWIVGRAIQHGTRGAIRLISAILYVVLVLFYVPVHWKFIARAITWIIDGRLPANNGTVVDALLFGSSAGTTTDSVPALLRQFALNTYASGLRHIFIFVVVHVALFVEHEWVVRDEGYLKMLTRRVGREPKARLADMFQNALNGLRHGQGDAAVEDRFDVLAAAINDLNAPQEWVDGANGADGADGPNGALAAMAPDNWAQAEADTAPVDTNEPQLPRDRHPEADVEADQMPAVQEPADQVPAQFNVPNLPQQAANLPQNPANRVHLDPPPPPPQQDMNEFVNNFDDAGDDNIFTLIGLQLDLKTPVVVMVLCNLVTTVYLTMLFLIPSIIGTFMVQMVGVIGLIVQSTAIRYNLSFNWPFDSINSYDMSGSTAGQLVLYLASTIANKVLAACTDIFSDQPSSFGRTFVLLVGYSVLAGVVKQAMASLQSLPKPLVGSQRKIYSILFEISCTLKVFFIFAIEIFFFPLYCGWLLDFCFAPILLDLFIVSTNPVRFTAMFTHSSPYLSIPYVQIALYWASGTLYMLLFALFVGMARSKILRRGVLFFIRSPDDPNARLIHDALVKPLGLQLSRIYLSAKVYSTFILVGIGAVTWGLRALADPDWTSATTNVLFPVSCFHIYDFLAVGFTALILIRNKQAIIKHVTNYWKFAFQISCHKLRLSHFILDRPIAEERGYVVYKNLWYQLVGATPDYSNPVTYPESKRLFATTNATACFVPDGNYIRVPNSDSVSRSYVKKLFVNVTKDDQLLDSNTNDSASEIGLEASDSDSDLEYIADNNYVVVYKPPALKWRCFQLILMLWVFAVVLILSVLFGGLALGRPVTKAVAVAYGTVVWCAGGAGGAGGATNTHLMPFIEQFINENFQWHLADARSICYGVLGELAVLLAYERRSAQQQPIPANNNAIVLNDNFTPRQEHTAKLLMILSKSFSIIWTSFVHIFVIDLSYSLVAGGMNGANGGTNGTNGGANGGMAVTDIWAILFHLMASPFTIYPAFNIGFIGKIQAMSEFNWWQVADVVDLTNNCVKAALVVLSIPLIGTRWSVVVFWTYVVGFLAVKMARQVQQYGEEIKNERYVRGRALENVE